MHLFPELYQFMFTIMHGLIHIWIVGAPHQMIHPFSIFQDGRELDNLPRGQKKYNRVDNIMKLVERESGRGGGWEREWLVKKVSVFYW